MAAALELTHELTELPKAATGIPGLDEVLAGGLPRGRPTLVTGQAGCGKSLMGLEFLVHGALDFGEPGVLMAFEESAADLAANAASLGFDLGQLESDGLLVIDTFRLDPDEIIESGAYDLEGLFIRLAFAVGRVGATRVVLDTVEVLFDVLEDRRLVRTELARLFRWLKDHELTALVTSERGDGTLTRSGVGEYVSDCVITLDHRAHDQVSTRRARVVKYRGSTHGTNEYPFVITDRGIAVLPITSLGLDHVASTERLSTGVERLDAMLSGGVYRGSSVLISGEAGTGKTTVAAFMADAACARGERALFVSFEESPSQLMRNMRSVGLDLQRWVDGGLLRLWSTRPFSQGMEALLVTFVRMVDEFDPSLFVLDAMTSLQHAGEVGDVTAAITREIDFLKTRGITAVVTSLGHGDDETSATAVSSLMDTWLLLRNIETNGERNRLVFVRKSRGMAHSNQVREFCIRESGIELVDVSVGSAGVLTGSARLAQAAALRADARRRAAEVDRLRREHALHRTDVEAQIERLRRELADEAAQLASLDSEQAAQQERVALDESAMAAQRWADPAPVLTDGENR